MVEIFMLGFFCVNDNEDVDVKCPQTMRCITCYNNQVLVYNLKIQTRKHLIIYNTTNGITTLKKTCECKPCYYCKNVWGRSKQSIEKRSEETTCKKIKNQIHIIV